MRAFLAIAQLALSLPSASSLSQRVAVVTGSSRGIGKGIAVELGRAGFAVYALSRSSRRNVFSWLLPSRKPPPGDGLNFPMSPDLAYPLREV